jgi:integrase
VHWSRPAISRELSLSTNAGSAWSEAISVRIASTARRRASAASNAVMGGQRARGEVGGESVKVVQAQLGHATAAETPDTYSHLWPDSEDQTREAIDQVLGAERQNEEVAR